MYLVKSLHNTVNLSLNLATRATQRHIIGCQHDDIVILYCKKNVRTPTDILRRVFHILMFVSVNRRHNEARAHITML